MSGQYEQEDRIAAQGAFHGTHSAFGLIAPPLFNFAHRLRLMDSTCAKRGV